MWLTCMAQQCQLYNGVPTEAPNAKNVSTNDTVRHSGGKHPYILLQYHVLRLMTDWNLEIKQI